MRWRSTWWSPEQRDGAGFCTSRSTPNAYQPTWYEHARRVIMRFLLDPDRVPGSLVEGEERIRATPPTRRNEAQKLRDNADAVAAFAACAGRFALDGAQVGRGPASANLLVEGVTISVYPDVLVRRHHRGREVVGGVKLYFSKRHDMGTDGLAIIGSLLHTFIRDLSRDGEHCATRDCQALDVFAERCACAPTAVVRSRREVEATCLRNRTDMGGNLAAPERPDSFHTAILIRVHVRLDWEKGAGMNTSGELRRFDP